jgi:succinoglycan biosynthesis protein ExoW
MIAEVAIVMPYFQRQPGILRATLQTVFAQRNSPTFNLIIVDDGSPAPVDIELQDLTDRERSQITLIRQSNQGVAAACNVGLAAVPRTAQWIARLDSDDHWDPDHLARGVAMMRAGFDFFFANEQGGEPVPRLEVVGFRASDHIPRDEGPELYEMRSGGFLDMMLEHAQVCSSTVLMGNKFASLRYRKTHAMCEDMHLFLDIALQSPRVAFSSRVHVTHGPGVHVNHVADWKSNRALRTACDFVEYYRRILIEVKLTPTQASFIRKRYAQCRTDVATVVLGMLGAGRIPDLGLMRRFIWQQPSTLKDLVGVAVGRVAGRTMPKPSKA